MSADEIPWAPESCTLPTAERPLRLREFDDLFRMSLIRQHRVSATRLHWELAPTAAETARDLTARESSCCSFFTFTITTTTDALWVDVVVPPAHVGVLDALAIRAAEGMRS